LSSQLNMLLISLGTPHVLHTSVSAILISPCCYEIIQHPELIFFPYF
jgi:hypothetical protein